MLRIAVCDDLPVCVEKLTGAIESWACQRQVNVQLKKFARGEEVLFDQEAAGDFTAVFMDVELEGMDGMETAARLREKNSLLSVVFVSQYEGYFKQMFQVYPCQFIEKPVAQEKVYDVLDKIVREQRVSHESFLFRSNRKTVNISLGEVLYFASEKRIIKIRMKSGREYAFYEKLDQLEQTLEDYSNQFIRIHQSYLINGRQIEQFFHSRVMMRNGDVLPVSRDKKGRLMQFYISFMEEEC